MTWRAVPAGFVSGPSRLNAVRTPISRRVGPACFIAGWKFGAKRNAKPSSWSAAEADAASWSIRTPRASSTSAEPAFEVIARLPCFATGTPAPATTSAAVVEMLSVPLPSPPVPTTSIAPAGASTRDTRSRIAAANPASSSIVSPRIRRPISSAASCAGVASPSITAPIARRDSSIESVPPSTIVERADRTRSLIGPPPRDELPGHRRRPARTSRTSRLRHQAGRPPLPRPGAGSWRGDAVPAG